MKMIEAVNNSDLFIKAVNSIRESGKTYDAGNSQINSDTTTALQAAVCQVSNPRDRWLTIKGRNHSSIAAIAETMWVLSGSNNIQFLSKFLHRAASFSDDGETWRAGYARLFNYGQVDSVIRRLSENPNSRQAYLSIYDPALDSDEGLLKTIGHLKTKDMVCNTTLMFSITNGKLDLCVTNRSQDILFGMCSINLIEFTILQEILAEILNVDVGYYRVFTNNLHFYNNELTANRLKCVSADSEAVIADKCTNIFTGSLHSQSDINSLFSSVIKTIENDSDFESVLTVFDTFGITCGLLLEMAYLVHCKYHNYPVQLHYLSDPGLIQSLKVSSVDSKILEQ